MKNSDRHIVGSIARYAAQRGLKLDRHSHDWILQLTRGGAEPLTHTIFGYDLGLNTSSAHRLANDKSAAFDVLNQHNVPAVEHRVFLHPRLLDFIDTGGNWRGLLDGFEAFRRDAVLKDNEGTGGYEVHRVRSTVELEQRALQLFQVTRGIALSPYLPIDDEMRFIMLGAACEIAYRKERVTILGDGVQTTVELIAAGQTKLELSEIDNPGLVLDQVPKAGERIPLQWRHNLGRGAKAVLIDPQAPEFARSLALARQTMQALSLEFASVDVVEANGKTLVLEVNSGVMLEMLVRLHPEGTALMDRIYHRALDWKFGSRI